MMRVALNSASSRLNAIEFAIEFVNTDLFSFFLQSYCEEYVLDHPSVLKSAGFCELSASLQMELQELVTWGQRAEERSMGAPPAAFSDLADMALNLRLGSQSVSGNCSANVILQLRALSPRAKKTLAVSLCKVQLSVRHKNAIWRAITVHLTDCTSRPGSCCSY